MSNQIQAFDQFEDIRTHTDKAGTTWYVVIDVIDVLAKPKHSGEYWRQMKNRDESGELRTICTKFPFQHRTNGRTYQRECATQAGILRIIQSIPSPRAEPFRQWLAVTGSRRLDEIKASAIEAERERLRLLGFSDKEIEHRLNLLIQSGELRAEWATRGVDTDQAETLTDVIHKGTFDGMTRKEHADFKNLDNPDALRDHMTGLEVAFTMLGEASTMDEIAHRDPQGYDENEEAAEAGGKSAGRLRIAYEEEKGRKVISDKSPIKPTELPPGEDG